MKSFGLTDKGLKREYNEDHYFRCDERLGNLPNLYIVADGMGGHNAGDIASKQAVAYMIKYIEDSEDTDVTVLLTDAVLYANQQVYNEGKERAEYSGMGTTLVACCIVGDTAHVVNVGDSRLYKLNKEEGLKQVTVDHSIVEELYRAGQISEKERMAHPDRNVITRAIGAEGAVAVDHFKVAMDEGDLIVMCSDGLNKMMEDSVMMELIQNEDNDENVVSVLVDGALERGGNDNITVIIVRYGSGVLE